MGQALLVAALVHPLCSSLATASAQPASLPPDLVQREESEAQAHRSRFGEWCRSEVLSQTKQRSELLQLRDQVSPPDGDAVLLESLSQQSDTLARSLEHKQREAFALLARQQRASAALGDLGRQVATLAAVQEELERKSGAQGNSGAFDGSLQVLRGLLARARESQEQAAAQAEEGPEALRREEQDLEQQYQSKAATLAQLRAQRRAASVGQNLVLAALEDEDAFLADLQSLCTVGKAAYRRLDDAMQPTLRSAAETLAQRPQLAAAAADLAAPEEPALAAPPPTPPAPAPPASPPPPPPRAQPVPVAAVDAAPLAAPPAVEAVEVPRAAPRKLRRHVASPPLVQAASHAAAPRSRGAAAAPLAQQPPPVQPAMPAPAARAPPAPLAAEEAAAEEDAGPPAAAAAAAPVSAVDASVSAEDDAELEAPPPPSRPSHRKHARHVEDVDAATPPADTAAKADGDVVAQEPRGRLRSTGRSARAGTSRVALADTGVADGAEVAVPAAADKATAADTDAAPSGGAPAWSPARGDRLKRLEKDLNGFESEEPPPAPRSGAPQPASPMSDLRGGWQSLVKKNKKKGARKHVFPDQTSRIADLVQTPTTYTAWHPEHSDAAMAASAKSELLAAERAFDEDRPASFLQLDGVAQQTALEQRLPPAAEGGVLPSRGGPAAAASLLLERYARSLGSAALLQLSRTHLDVGRLNSLWQEVQVAGEEGGREAQAVSWCRDFKREAQEKAEADHAARVRAAANLTEVEAEQHLLEQEAAAQERVLQVFHEGSDHLKSLLSQVRARTASLLGTIRTLQKQAQQLAGQDESGLRESLGRAEGQATSGSAEVEDLVSAALSRRQDAERSRKAAMDELQQRLAALASRGMALKADTGRQRAGEQAGSLRAHYDQICKWTLEDLQARRHKEEAERDAIHAALAVLSAH